MSTFKNFAQTLKDKLGYDPREVELISANAISPELIDEVRQVYGHNIIIKQTIDPVIVGGVKIKIGDLILDASVQQQFDELTGAISGTKAGEGSIAEQIRLQLEKFQKTAKVSEVGQVIEVKDGICRISGLTNCMYQETLEFMNGTKALAFNLEKDNVGAIILGDFTQIKEGDLVKRTKAIMSIGVGDQLLGRVINSVGTAIDGGTDLKYSEFNPVEKVAPGVIARQPVRKPLQTGIKAIDALIPIGRGQRELILGDRQTGKTAIAIDTIVNQKNSDVTCIYVAVGQKESKVAKLVAKLRESGAMEYTVVVSASASEQAPMLFLAPYAGVAIAEYFAAKGKDVLVVYDDLSKHAVAYREMSLLLRRPPGREAYPGDVFYLHSRLLERACSLNKENGGGSITALPIIETQAGDISAYIPTNVISITDGQIFLETDLFYRGIRPAVNVGLSVSRVGGEAQIKPMKKVAGSIKLALAQFRELEAFSQFSSDLDPKTKQQIEKGKRITEMLKQKQFSPLNVEDQVVVIWAVNNGFMDEFPVEQVTQLEPELIDFVRSVKPNVIEDIKAGIWEEKVEAELREACESFVKKKSENNG